MTALLTSGGFGICLFDAEGRVTALEGATTGWAPPVGASIGEANLFLGMIDSFAALRDSGESIEISGVSIGSDDARAVDVRIIRVADLNCFAAISTTASERNELQLRVSQIVRDNRLLEQKIREQQDKIVEQADLMRLFIRHVPAAVAMLDFNLEPMMLSQRWIEEFGDPSLGDDPDVSGSPLRVPHIDAALRLAMDTGITSARTERISQRGAVVWKRWEQTPWRRADRSVGGTILYFEDVTDAMRKDLRLRSQSKDLQNLNVEMRVLTRALASDLARPLQRIDDISKEAFDQITASSQRARIGEVRASVAHLKSMVAALRRYVETASRDFILTPFDIGEAVEMAAESLRGAIRAAGANVILHPTLSMNGDLRLMARVFELLLDNALKHAGGAPTITVDCIDDEGFIIVSVTDDGPGIPPHKHAQALEPFGRLESDAPVSDGMGLAKARKIVELHGGTLALDPGYELGLRVLINLPQDRASS